MNDTLERIKGIVKLYNSSLYNELAEDFEKCEKDLERLEKYEEILSEGRLIQDERYEEYNTDGVNCYGVKRIRNNATIKLGKLENIYEEVNKNE